MMKNLKKGWKLNLQLDFLIDIRQPIQIGHVGSSYVILELK